MFRDDAMAQFERWLHQQQQRQTGDTGGQQFLWSKVELRPVNDGDGMMGYGIFAREDIRLNETAIKVPERMMITAGMVADIVEYGPMLQRMLLEPAEVLAVFFCFERVHCDYFCAQPTPNGPFSVQWALDIPPGFARFMKMRMKRRQKCAADDEIWWRPYLGILPLSFGTPLFRHYLRGDAVGEVRLRRVAAHLPQEAKGKLMGQLAELQKLERKLFILLYAPHQMANFTDGPFDEDASKMVVAKLIDKLPYGSVEFWREMCCWAWHVVNTRCIFVPDLPFHPLVDKTAQYAAADCGDNPRRGEIKEKERRRRTMATGRRTFSAHGQCGTDESATNGTTRPTPAVEHAADGALQQQEEEEDDDAHYGGSLAIIPLVDMLNHSTDAQCVATFDHTHSRHYLVRADQHFVPAGHQLFVCYGAHDNARLWVEYGFRITDTNGGGDGNPFNRVSLPHDLFIALAERCGVRVSEKRREVLSKANLCCTMYASDEKPSFSLRKCCTILLMERDKLHNWSQHIFGEDDDDEEEEGEEGRFVDDNANDNADRDDQQFPQQHQKHQQLLISDENGDGSAAGARRQMDLLLLLHSILAHLQKALEGRRANCFLLNGGIGEGGEKGEEENGGGEEEEEAATVDEEEREILASLWEDQIDIVRRMALHLRPLASRKGAAATGTG